MNKTTNIKAININKKQLFIPLLLFVHTTCVMKTEQSARHALQLKTKRYINVVSTFLNSSFDCFRHLVAVSLFNVSFDFENSISPGSVLMLYREIETGCCIVVDEHTASSGGGHI